MQGCGELVVVVVKIGVTRRMLSTISWRCRRSKSIPRAASYCAGVAPPRMIAFWSWTVRSFSRGGCGFRERLPILGSISTRWRNDASFSAIWRLCSSVHCVRIASPALRYSSSDGAILAPAVGC